MRISSRMLKGGVAAAALIAAIGCQSNTAGLTDTPFSFNTEPPPPPGLHQVTVCKYGTDATFSVSIDGAAPYELFLADGFCQVVADNDGTQDAIVATVTELAMTGIRLDSIVKDSTFRDWRDANGIPCQVVTEGCTYEYATLSETILGTNTASGAARAAPKAIVLNFFNSRLQQGGEGCTPGYWKQPQHFDSWTAPYTPDMLFSDVFADAFSGMTLLDVLKQGGGGLKALGRHTVAALLNAAGAVNSGFTVGDVINAFNAAYASGDYDGQKNIFEASNEQGCPLN